MRVIAKKTLREFWQVHADSEQPLKAWYQGVEKGKWRNLHELQYDFSNLSILNNDRVCFNIKGNTYRLIVEINFNRQIMWILFIGTHSEYDKINANKI